MNSNAFLCCVVLAHKNVRQVTRLVRALRHDDVNVLVHFDKKMNEPFDEAELRKVNPNAKVLPFRNSNWLDTWSLVNTTMCSVGYCIDNQCVIGGGYLALMSGQDYPIKPIDSLVRELKNADGRAFIDCRKATPGSWHDSKTGHCQAYAKWYRFFGESKHVVLRRSVLKAFRIIESLFCPADRRMTNILSEKGVKVYGGSAWWVLPVPMLQEIRREYEKNHDLMDLLKGIITPEEIFFQTMAMRTSYAGLVDTGKNPLKRQNCLTLACFSKPNKPIVFHPYVLLSEDLEMLRQSPFFIARKFDMDVDEEILDLIDNKLISPLT